MLYVVNDLILSDTRENAYVSWPVDISNKPKFGDIHETQHNNLHNNFDAFA